MEKELNPEVKKRIKAMSYEEMLRLNRFAPCGEPLFIGVAGVFFFENMALKRIEIGHAGHVQASKNIGWG